MASLQDLIKLAEADNGKFFVMDETGEIKLVIMKVEDYEQVLVGRLGKTAVDIEQINKEITKAQLVDPVVPVPTGFAGEVYQQAVQVRDKSGCTRLAENYRKVAAMIAAGGINQVVDAKTQIVAFNQALNLSTSWKPFGVWIGQQANAKAQTITAARAFFEDTALGLETAAK